MTATTREAAPLDAVVVGAGVSGIAMAVALRRRGTTRFAVLEAGDDVGGTWRENRYPGCACDVPGRLYSFSFAPNPHWSRTYAPQPEIESYVREVAAAHGVLPHVRFSTRLRCASWDDDSATWRLAVETADGDDELASRLLVLATGPLHEPALPDVPGLSAFEGRSVHTARWDPGLDLRGDRVAVVGTGASAAQVVPELAGRTRHLTVVQRTPAWVLPRGDRAISARRRRLYARLPVAERLARLATYASFEARIPAFTTEPRLLRLAERVARRHLERQVPDSALRRALTPDYRLGCKRLVLSDDLYPALARPDVDLVPHALTGVDGRRIRTADGTSREVDTLVLATGFRVTERLPPLPVTGRGGRDLRATWAGGAAAYLGTSVAGFPNLFLLLGPNSGLGHSSVLLMAEAQVHHVVRAAAPVLDGAAASVEVTQRAYDGFARDVRWRTQRTVWASGCRSWYLDDRGRNVVLWPASTTRFWLRTRRIRAGTYALSPSTPQRTPTPRTAVAR